MVAQASFVFVKVPEVLMGFVYMQIARRDRETMRQMLAPIIRAVWADGRKPCLALISHPASRNSAGFSVEPTFCSNEMSSARRAAKTLQPTSCSSFQPAHAALFALFLPIPSVENMS